MRTTKTTQLCKLQSFSFFPKETFTVLYAPVAVSSIIDNTVTQMPDL